jgi:hypothetical protein
MVNRHQGDRSMQFVDAISLVFVPTIALSYVLLARG